MILEYTLSVAAVARGFRAYGATLLGLGPDAGLLHAGPLQLDFFALSLVLALCALLAASTADGATFNSGERPGAPACVVACCGAFHSHVQRVT